MKKFDIRITSALLNLRERFKELLIDPWRNAASILNVRVDASDQKPLHLDIDHA